MITLTLEGITVTIGEVLGQEPDGTQVRVPIVRYTDQQSGVVVVIPYGGESARLVGRHLLGFEPVAIARSLNGLGPPPA